MGRGMRYSAAKAREKVRIDDHREDSFCAIEAERLTREMMAQRYIGRFRAVVANPATWPAARAWAEKQIEYLSGGPARRLGVSSRERLDRLETALRLHAEGRPYEPEKSVRRRRLTPKRAPRPAWMNDPSLLPKRPPGMT